MGNVESVNFYTRVERLGNAPVEFGLATVQASEDFCQALDHHLQSGKLGGSRICARRRE